LADIRAERATSGADLDWLVSRSRATRMSMSGPTVVSAAAMPVEQDALVKEARCLFCKIGNIFGAHREVTGKWYPDDWAISSQERYLDEQDSSPRILRCLPLSPLKQAQYLVLIAGTSSTPSSLVASVRPRSTSVLDGGMSSTRFRSLRPSPSRERRVSPLLRSRRSD
jgi:hypothetical protein